MNFVQIQRRREGAHDPSLAPMSLPRTPSKVFTGSNEETQLANGRTRERRCAGVDEVQGVDRPVHPLLGIHHQQDATTELLLLDSPMVTSGVPWHSLGEEETGVARQSVSCFAIPCFQEKKTVPSSLHALDIAWKIGGDWEPPRLQCLDLSFLITLTPSL